MSVIHKIVKTISDINVRLQAIEYILVNKEVIDVKDMEDTLSKFAELRDARVKEYEDRKVRYGTFASYPNGHKTDDKSSEDNKDNDAHLLKW
jgi:hypothetical protein